MAKKIRQPKSPAVNPAATADEPAKSLSLRSRYFVFAGLASLCLAIYAQTLGFDFIDLDDDQYILNNPFVTDGFGLGSVKWALTAFYASNWHPLTWISHQIDVSLFGLEPGGHHAVNVILHIANSLLLFSLARRLTGAFWKSAAIAALFAVHPTHVESVAWIAERKDVLSTLFWLLSTYAYVVYASRTEPESPLVRRAFWLSLGLFALGLMAKPMLVTLPFTFLLLDLWPLNRFDIREPKKILPLIVEKIPFFVLAIISSVLTILAQRSGGAVQSLEVIPLGDRLANSTTAFAKYVLVFFYPADLGIWYPFDKSIGIATVAAAFMMIAGVTLAAVWQIRQRPFLIAGWLWFLGTLVPVIGLVQVGRQSMADRYTYVPYIGLTIVVVWLTAELFERFKINKTAVAGFAAIVIVAFTAIAARQTSYWKDSESIFKRTYEVTGPNFLVQHNLCRFLERRNRLDEAIAQCRAAIENSPELPDAYNTLGTIQIKQQRFDDARANFLRAIETRPQFVLAYVNLALIDANRNDLDSAVEFVKKAVEVGGDEFLQSSALTDAYAGIAVAAYKLQRYDRASEYFEKALAISPDNLDHQRNLAVSLHFQGRSAEGEKILLETIRKHPNQAEVHNSLGLIYAGQNRREEARAQFQKALQINPGLVPAQSNLRKLMEQK